MAVHSLIRVIGLSEAIARETELEREKTQRELFEAFEKHVSDPCNSSSVASACLLREAVEVQKVALQTEVADLRQTPS